MKLVIITLLIIFVAVVITFYSADDEGMYEDYFNEDLNIKPKRKWVDCPSKEKTCSGSVKSHWTCSAKSDCPQPGKGFEHQCVKGVCMRWKPETYDTTERLSNSSINIAYRHKNDFNKAFPTIYKNITGKEYKGKLFDIKNIDNNVMISLTDVLMISLKKNSRDDIISIWILFTIGLMNQLDQKTKRVLNITYNSIGQVDKITYTLNGLLCSPAILVNSYEGLSKTVKIDETSKKLMESAYISQKVTDSLKTDYDPYMSLETFSNLLIYQISKLGGFYV